MQHHVPKPGSTLCMHVPRFAIAQPPTRQHHRTFTTIEPAHVNGASITMPGSSLPTLSLTARNNAPIPTNGRLPFVHRRLDHSKRSIRLLTTLPDLSSSDGMIHCSMIHTTLDRASRSINAQDGTRHLVSYKGQITCQTLEDLTQPQKNHLLSAMSQHKEAHHSPEDLAKLRMDPNGRSYRESPMMVPFVSLSVLRPSVTLCCQKKRKILSVSNFPNILLLSSN